MGKLLSMTDQWISAFPNRVLNFKTFIIVCSLLMSLVMAFLALLGWSPLRAILLFGIVVCCVLIVIEPFYGLCIFLMLAMLHPEQNFPALTKFHLFDILGGLAAISWIVHSVVEKRRIFLKVPQTFLIIGLYLTMIASVMVAADSNSAKEGLHEFSLLFLICFMMMSMVDNKERIRIMIWVPLVFGLYMSYRAVRVGSISYALDLYRINHNYGGTNALSMLMIVLIPVSWSMIFGEKNRILKIASAVACVLYTIANLKTISRGGFISFGIVLIFMMAITPKGMRSLSIVIALILVVLVPAMAPEGYFDEMRTTLTYQNQTADVKRVNLKEFGLELFKSSPIFGIGLNNFTLASEGTYSHDTYIQVLAELGFVGFSLFFSLITLAFYDLWKAIHLLKDRDKDRLLYSLSRGIQVSLISLLFRFFFINAFHLNIVYILFMLSTAIRINVEKEYARDIKNAGKRNNNWQYMEGEMICESRV